MVDTFLIPDYRSLITIYQLLFTSRLLLTLALTFVPISAYALTDIDDYKYKSAIDMLHARGIVDGYDDGSFLPNSPINRAEFLKLVMLSAYGDQGYTPKSQKCFADFTGDKQWFWEHACAAKELGIIHGYPDGTFRGTDTINLAEALKISFEAWQTPLAKDDPRDAWYERYMRKASERNVFNRFPFTPSYQLTRGEMAQLLVMLGEPIAVLNPNFSEHDPTVSVVPKPLTQSVCGNGIVEGAEQCDDGNKKNGDGCSSICVVVSEPVRHGALRLSQQSIANVPQTSGNRDVPIMAFRAIAGRQDVYITTLKFKSEVGSLQYGENYRLFIDRDSSGTVDTLIARGVLNGETLTFANLNILVKDGVYMRIELWADIDTSLTASSMRVGFDTTQPDFVEGVGRLDGEDVTGIVLNDSTCQQEDICWITVETLDNDPITIRTQGNLYVSQASSPVPSKQVLAGSVTSALMKLHLRTDGEDIIVNSLAIEGVPSVVDKLYLYEQGSTNVLATLSNAYCSSITSGRYCTDKDFTVPANTEKDIEIRAKLLSDEEGAISNQSISLSINPTTTGNVAVRAQGKNSGQQLLQNNNNATAEGEVFIGTQSAAANTSITAQTHTVTFAKLEDIVSTHTDSDGSPVGTGPTTFAQFSFKAAPNGNSKDGLNSVSLRTLRFTVGAVNVAFDATSFYIFNTQNSGAIHTCSANNTTGTITVTCSNIHTGQISASIAQGGQLTLALRGTIENAQVSPGGSSLQASLKQLGDPAETGIVEWSDGANTFDWVDIGKTDVKSTAYRL